MLQPHAWAMEMGRMLESLEGWPMNFGLLGKGNVSMPRPLEEQVASGACD